MSTPKKANGIQAYCAFCAEPTTRADLCHGCGIYICDDCDQVSCGGLHEADDHRFAEQGDEFDELNFNDNED